ncbi:DUF1801 domain-containing protein [Microbacterium sp. NPDC056234]|uniref:DUF1801 domain-containing protein n=1 Tax=Microbacterium sp. NPDC056234 TaxID=3345757 RepID=UPI0035D55D52
MARAREIDDFHARHPASDRAIFVALAEVIERGLPEAVGRIWHAHPVWFLDGNPIVGYNRLKDAVRLMFWSGRSFDEPGLTPTGTFQAGEVRYTDVEQVDVDDLVRWLAAARDVQWDYEHIRTNRGLVTRTDF